MKMVSRFQHKGSGRAVCRMLMFRVPRYRTGSCTVPETTTTQPHNEGNKYQLSGYQQPRCTEKREERSDTGTRVPGLVREHCCIRDLQHSQFGCLKEIFKFAQSMCLSNIYEKMGLCCQESQKLFAPEQEHIWIRPAPHTISKGML